MECRLPTAEGGSYRLYYQTWGEGPPLILLHNATGSTRDWRRIAPLLAAGGYRVIAYDRQGFGRSDPLPYAHWPLDYLHHSRDELLALMDALGIEQAALVGHSDGATIALLAAAQAPQRVRAVVAEAPHMWYERETLIPAFEWVKRTLLHDERFWRAMERAHGQRAREVVGRWVHRWTDPAFYGWDERVVLPRVVCPVLVMHGQEDPFFSVEHSEAIARGVENGQLLVFEGVGHVIGGTIVNDYAQQILRFLQTEAPNAPQ